jgi:polypeptide N-acetylgalactosaminyltransferase
VKLGRFKDVNDIKNKLENEKKNVIGSENNKKSSTPASFINKIKSWFIEDDGEAKNPSDWPGEGGKAVVLSPVQRDESKKRFKENQFNIVASDLIALNRSLTDQRSAKCKKREYPSDLPTTSIIIVYHNEGNSTLLRGLTSIVRRSPPSLLKEIILVDDASEKRDYLHGPLDEFAATMPVPVKIYRNEERMGLMRSRMRGAAAATGDTMTFLDAHIEVTRGWLEPLLAEIKTNKYAHSTIDAVKPLISGLLIINSLYIYLLHFYYLVNYL